MPLPVIRGVPFTWTEDILSPLVFEHGPDGGKSKRVYYAKFEDLYQSEPMYTVKRALSWILGTVARDESASLLVGSTLVRTLPMTDPDDPTMLAVRASVKGVGPRGRKEDEFLNWPTGDTGTDWPAAETPEDQAGGFETYRFEVDFAHVPFLVSEDDDADSDLGEWRRYVVASWSGTSEYLTLPNGIVGWKADAANPLASSGGVGVFTPISFGAGVVKTSGTLVVNWLAVPEEFIRTTYDDDYANHVNAEAITLPYPGDDGRKTFAAETLLLQPVEISPTKFAPLGVRLRDLKIAFRYRKDGWNKAISSDGNYYRLALAEDYAQGPYPTADFEELKYGVGV